jgi:flagellar motor protein MotB
MIETVGCISFMDTLMVQTISYSRSVNTNKKLSQARADEVKRILVGRGISANRLSSEDKGSAEPLNADDPAAAINRRGGLLL